jgi:hypothetical protein
MDLELGDDLVGVGLPSASLGASLRTPVSVEMVPPPSLMPPFQTAHAFLIMTAPQVVVPERLAEILGGKAPIDQFVEHGVDVVRAAILII